MVNTEFIDDDGTRVVFTADDMAELDMTSLVILRFIMKLENCRHHGDFEKLVRYVRDNEPHKLHTSYFINIGRLRKLVRAGRSSIEQGIENFATVQLLLKWEAEEQSDPTHFVREVTPNMEPTRSQKREMEIAEIKAALALPIGDAAKKALEMRLEVLVNAPTLKQKKERSVEQIRAMTDKKLQKRLDELAKAKEAGNDQRVKELEFAIRQLKANLGIGAPVVVESNKARRERERQELIAILEVNLRDAMREGRVEDVIYYGAEINKLKVASEQASKSSDV
jgi:mRNA-degrading endonuclease toxin of MazEF toxin-antitoxin module